MDKPTIQPSRVFRMVVSVEVIVTVDGDREVTVIDEPGNHWMRLDTDDGLVGRLEPAAMFHELVEEHDAGPHMWTSAVAIESTPIQELTP